MGLQKTVTLYCPEYYIYAINQTAVLRNILITHRDLIGFKMIRHDKSPLFNVLSVEVIWQECRRMLMLPVSMRWCRGNKYKSSKCIFFQTLQQNMVENIFQCHDNNIWKISVLKFYVIVMRPIFDTTYKGGK